MVKLGPFEFITGSGHIVTESREARDFDSIVLTGSGSIVIAQTGEESLTIEADDNILPLLTSEVHGRRLELGVRHSVSFTLHNQIRYHITVKDLRELTITGSGKVEAPNLTTDELSLTISGSSDMRLPSLTADALSLTISGSGDVSLSGQAARQEIHISGSGSYHAADLASDRARVRVSGSGNATLNVRETLDARISGVGSIRYAGQPAITKSISGSGSIRPLHG